MKRLSAALMLSALTAAKAAAQVAAPIPPPVQSFPLRVQTPQQYAPPRNDQPPVHSEPAYEAMPPIQPAIQPAMPTVRVPDSFAAPYAAPVPTTCNVYQGSHGHANITCGAPGCCNQAGCGGCAVCGPYGRIWGEFDYLYWRASGDRVPPLVTTSPAGTAQAAAGVLGTPGVAVLAGGTGLGDAFRSGVRVNVGGWFNDAQTFGVQFGGFYLNDADDNSAFASNGNPILSRPYLNAVNGAQNSELVAFPGILSGAVGVEHTTSVMGLDAALRGNTCCNSCYRLDALLGYRYLRLEDSLGITENLTAGPLAGNGIPVGTNILVRDSFVTSNTFNGIQTGIAGEYRFWDRFIFSGAAKASIGWNDQVANVFGATSVTVPGGGTVQNAGGLLALSSNIGRYSRSDAVIVPEVNLNLGMQLTDNVRLRAGYNFLYVSTVTRPGGIIDTSVNPALIPGPGPVANPVPVRPVLQQQYDDFILHGINAGLEVRF